jgi:hemoglobin/transferrin/lactoferrin receptor protein
VAVRWMAVASKDRDDIPNDTRGQPLFPPTNSYNLVNLYIGYQINPNALASLSVENLFNEQYTKYLTIFPNELTQTITGFPQPGITVKGSLKVRFAG